MTMYDDGPVHEPFGPEYVRPKNADCPDCACCTAVLCAKGRASVLECSGHVDAEPELVERVTNCPCSAESTRGTLSWRAAMVRAVTFATEKPLREELEALLARIGDGPVDGGLEPLLPKVVVRRYVKWAPGLTPELTDFGRAYLDAWRGVPRVESLVRVLSVDEDARTVQTALPAFSVDQPVTVPLDILANSRTELSPKGLEGVTLYAEVNPGARAADDVVLTKVRNPAVARPDSPDGGQ
ncbi:hypothetical protein OOK58_42005 [Streptomyces sp. NBC_01728]|uniref:hypothetical protein n=1 Tax=unclassified Streptomyces TaxID=2593676 RepID=UPI00225347C8|nr:MULTISPECIES: hypothetical protein [unclassified Streptomyces]MCX4458489.1 hypothetical protein [Streptomyces sp. NBC_01719]MCX4497846.1 hypothetical protein [Streptomyces sp. NBC_01728]